MISKFVYISVASRLLKRPRFYKFQSCTAHENFPVPPIASSQNCGSRCSGAGTKLKVGEGGTICRLGERCRDGQYSLASFLFAVLLLTVVPPCPAICKSGGTWPHPVPHGVGATAQVPKQPRSSWMRRCQDVYSKAKYKVSIISGLSAP